MQTIWYLSQIYIYIYTLQYLFPFHFTGAIFTEEQKDGTAELAFKYAVYRINKDKSILPRTTLTYDIQYVPRDDSFRTTKKGKLAMGIRFLYLLRTRHRWHFAHNHPPVLPHVPFSDYVTFPPIYIRIVLALWYTLDAYILLIITIDITQLNRCVSVCVITRPPHVCNMLCIICIKYIYSWYFARWLGDTYLERSN